MTTNYAKQITFAIWRTNYAKQMTTNYTKQITPEGQITINDGIANYAKTMTLSTYLITINE